MPYFLTTQYKELLQNAQQQDFDNAQPDKAKGNNFGAGLYKSIFLREKLV